MIDDVSPSNLGGFFDLDRVFDRKNLLVTIICSILAFSIAIIGLIIDIPSTKLILFPVLVFLLIAAVFTRNITSIVIVGIIGLIAIPSPNNTQVDYIFTYILLTLIILMISGYLSNKLMTIRSWNKLYLLSSLLFSFYFIFLNIFTSTPKNYNSSYQSLGINIEFWNDLGVESDLPLLDVVILLTIMTLIIVFFIMFRGQIILKDDQLTKYKVIGLLICLSAQLFAIISLYLFITTLTNDQLIILSRNVNHLNEIENLFAFGGNYIIITAPLNIYYLASIYAVLSSIGISIYDIGKYSGNLDSKFGGSNILFIAPSLALFVFSLFGNYYITRIFTSNPAIFYVSIQLLPILFTLIWSFYFINQLIARFIMFILEIVKLTN
ncbi:MAG: hypothetical protein OEY49_08245 [Candidatus Heimdallarchaeota archaeon]|nr:hypothetical protein [Candidatus Heimdallarchaeota archaeon]